MCFVILGDFSLVGSKVCGFHGSRFFCVFSVQFCRIGLFLMSESSFMTFLVLNIPGFLKRGCFLVSTPSLHCFSGRYFTPFRFPLSLLVLILAGGSFLFLSSSFFHTLQTKNKRQLITRKKHLIRTSSPHLARKSSFSS